MWGFVGHGQDFGFDSKGAGAMGGFGAEVGCDLTCIGQATKDGSRELP